MPRLRLTDLNGARSRSAVWTALALLSLLAARPTLGAGPAEVGRWAEPRNWPVLAIHSIVLPTGDVLNYSYADFLREHPGSQGVVYDPKKDRFRNPFVFEYDFFCSGHSVLPDGRVFVTGGWIQGRECNIEGPDATYLYDPLTGEWAVGPVMKRGRYYPTNVALGDGRVLILAGEDVVCEQNALVEIFDPLDDSLEVMKKARLGMNPYPRVHLLSDGRIAKVGVEDRTYVLDVEARKWSAITRTQLRMPRFEGSSWLVPGEEDVVMTCGGFTTLDTNPTATCERIDFKKKEPKWEFTRPMSSARAHANAVVLPDATVLMVGGGHEHLYDGPVLLPELYDPKTDIWRTLPSQRWSRMYHSTAVLLPDGRVLSAGQDDDHTGRTGSGARAEFYEPPYLFRGRRPTIKKAPDAAGYGETIRIKAKQARMIESAVLMRPGATTHSVNMEQRYVPLEFDWQGAKRMDLHMPKNPNLAPPGYYMLFLVNQRGAVSKATFLHLGVPDETPVEE